MNRSLTAFAAAAALALAACQPASTEVAPPGSEPQPEPAAAPPAATAAEVPANFDWHFVTHGGSGDLSFGDGDWAEGESLVQLSCLPNSQNVSISWGNAEPAKLSSGGHSVDLAARNPAAAPADPVFKALRASGELTIVQGGASRTLSAKDAGKKAVEDFFAYCTMPLKA